MEDRKKPEVSPFDSVDPAPPSKEVNISKLGNTLGDENTFVISHKGDQLVDKFRNSIRFVKQQNFSRIA